MKKYVIFSFILSILGIGSFASASLSSDTPEQFLDRLVQTSNSNFSMQKTQLDDVSAKSSRGLGGKTKITGTLGNLATQIEPYLQWLTFIGLTAAVILLTWNGFKLVMNSSGMVDGGDMKTVKGNITQILTGVVILTGFIAIIKLVVALINFLFSQ